MHEYDDFDAMLADLREGRDRRIARTPAVPRSGRRVALVCRTPGLDFKDVRDELPSYGVRRIHASLLGDPSLDGLEVRTFECMGDDLDAVAEAVLAYDPDVVGFSAYVWSLPKFLMLARRLRDASPGALLVFGGPSALADMFTIEPYKSGVHLVDALVISHGEESIRDLVRLERRTLDAVAAIPGVSARQGDAFTRAISRPSARLDDLPSPAVAGLIPRGSWHYLETYRGCPMSCSFCQWGRAQAPKDVLSTERIAAELDAFARNEAFGVVHLDAGLTLNERAFRNFSAAEREVGFLGRSRLSCEVYPSHLKPAHVEFLQSVGCSYVGVGLQSYNEEVLKNVHRSAKPETFDEIVRRLVAAVGNIAIEIIMGLPGDSPESFRRTAERALELGADVHAFHCLVLPDAFLSKAPDDFALDFDPITLKVRSCKGWTADELVETREWMTGMTANLDGRHGDQEWITGRFLRSDVRPRGVPKETDARWPAPVTTPRVSLPIASEDA